MRHTRTLFKYNAVYHRNLLINANMSRAKEIQEKLALNAKLQAALSANTSKVLGWLGDSRDEKDSSESQYKEKDQAYSIKDLEDSKKMFFELPVVQIGSGLNMGDSGADDAASSDIHTIGEFVKSNKKISSLAKKKKRSENLNERNNIYRVAKDDTRAMVALKNKIRSGRREEMRRNGLLESRKTSGTKDTRPSNNRGKQDESDDESSDDDEGRRPAAAKKSVNLLFGSKKKGRK